MISGIYCITNTVNGKHYVGSSVNILERWKRHTRLLQNNRHHSTHLQNAWNKYGLDKFEFSIVLICDPQNVLIYEQCFIDFLHPEYNVSPTAQNSTGVIRSEEYCKKQSVAQTGKVMSLESRQKISEGMKGKRNSAGIKRIHSEETKEKIRVTLLGHIVSQETREKIGSKNRNNKHTDEAKRRISQSLIGNKRAASNA